MLKGFPENARDETKSYFLNRGVSIYPHTTFDFKKNVNDDYDLVIMACGQQYHTPFFENEQFSDCRDVLGRIYVNEFFQVTNVDPTQEVGDDRPVGEKVYPNIFCYGDASVTKMREVKNVLSIIQTCELVAKNIIALDDESNTSLTKMPTALDFIAGIHHGMISGFVVLNDFSIWNPITKYNKNSLMKEYMGWLNQNTCSGCNRAC